MKKKEINRKEWLVPRLRRLSQQWPIKSEAMRLARVSRGKYECNICKNIFGPKEIELDHINPVIPVNIPFEHLSLNVYISNLFCDISNYQVLCINHHVEKSLKENQERDEWTEKTKYIVYRTVNNINGKSYIGIHKCIDYNDGYLGSGTRIKLAIKKYGKDFFSREVLYCYDTLDSALKKEKELVNEEFLSNDDIYNLAIGGRGINPNLKNLNSKKIICHETGEMFNSITEASQVLHIDGANISRILNNPNDTVQDKHFFTTNTYDPSIYVTFPRNQTLKRIVHLNTRTIYPSIKDCCEILNLSYKSIRNALCIKNESGVHEYKDNYFLYEEEYDASEPIVIYKQNVLCVELNLTFDTYRKAAEYLKHQNPIHGGIAIGKAIRETRKMYGYTWKLIDANITL